jgi:hypothetical protein
MSFTSDSRKTFLKTSGLNLMSSFVGLLLDRGMLNSNYSLSFGLQNHTTVYELNNLESSPNIIRVIKSRRMRWAGHVAHMGEKRGVYRILVGRPEGRRPLGKPRRRWEDNIKMDLQEVGWEHGLDCAGSG